MMVWYGYSDGGGGSGASGATEATLSSGLGAISSALASNNIILGQVSSTLLAQMPILGAIRDGKAVEAINKLATTVSGSTTNIQVLPARPTRRYALITLRSYSGSNGVYLSHSANAVLNTGEALLNVGSTYQIDVNNFSTQAINAISDAAFSLSIEEFYD